jgi:hypothetical protein
MLYKVTSPLYSLKQLQAPLKYRAHAATHLKKVERLAAAQPPALLCQNVSEASSAFPTL